MNKKPKKRNLLVYMLIIVLLIIVFVSGTKLIEVVLVNKRQQEETVVSTKTIERDGVEYFPRQDITVMMVMGIDRSGPVKPSGSYNNDGAADMVSLVVFDETDETYSVVLLNRDTMMDIPVLGIGGKPAGTINGQLALAHTFGSGMEDSCENTVDAVSGFLYGLNIDYYLSMNMDAISILTDAVGGVEVTVEDDFSKIDKSISKGKTVLDGEQAVSFIRTRKNVGDQLNVSRMERHTEFMDGFIDSFAECVEEQGSSFVANTYEKVEDYVVTDCSVTTMSSIMERCEGYEFAGTITPDGKNVKGKEYMEFHVNEDKLDKMILDMFYSPK